MQSFIASLANDQTENNIEKDSVSTTDQINLSDDTSKKKDGEVTELRASLNNFNELKAKVKYKNNEISRLKKELGRNNAQENEINRLRNELDQTKISKQTQENEINRLRNELDQNEISKQAQKNEINRLKNELDQAINSLQARIMEEIEESRFFEPQEIKNPNRTPIKKVIEEKPNFSCKGALNWVEKVICDNPSLAELDRKISRAYKNALTSTHNNKAKNKLIAKQKKWLSTRHQCKEDFDKTLCLKTEYIKQLVFLQGKHFIKNGDIADEFLGQGTH